MSGTPTIRQVRAFTTRGGGADYHDQTEDHWIDGPIATPMSRYPAYRAHRSSFGLNVLGTVVVEVEASDGTVGFAVTTGGEPACWIIENHLARFVEGSPVDGLEQIWDQMFNATLYYGRRGLALNAISGVDLALYDLLGRIRQQPVYALLGGAVRDEITFYATGPRPDLAKEMGFIGGKIPLLWAPADGRAARTAEVRRLEEFRATVGEDFFLSLDCWMSLDQLNAAEFLHEARNVGLRWIEEALPPDDYWGYRELRRRLGGRVAVSTGEHEATRWGFRMLLEMECADIWQPDVGWCGGLTELIKISALAEANSTLVIPHGSSVYSYHYVITRQNSPFAEFLMMHPDASEVVPMFSPLLLNEPVPVNGRMTVPDLPGFGVELNPECALDRPYAHG